MVGSVFLVPFSCPHRLYVYRGTYPAKQGGSSISRVEQYCYNWHARSGIQTHDTAAAMVPRSDGLTIRRDLLKLLRNHELRLPQESAPVPRLVTCLPACPIRSMLSFKAHLLNWLTISFIFDSFKNVITYKPILMSKVCLSQITTVQMVKRNRQLQFYYEWTIFLIILLIEIVRRLFLHFKMATLQTLQHHVTHKNG